MERDLLFALAAAVIQGNSSIMKCMQPTVVLGPVNLICPL